MGAVRSLVCLLALTTAAPALAATEAEALQEILRSRDPVSVKLSALEVYKATNGAGALGFLDKKDYTRLQESLQSELEPLASAGDGARAFALWMRYLRALPADSGSERFRRYLPILAAPVRLELSRAEELYAREDYLAAWRAASDIKASGAGLEGAATLQAKSSAAGDLAARFDTVWARVSLEGTDPEMSDLERISAELGRLHASGAAPRRVRSTRLLAEARELHRNGDLSGLRGKLDEISSLGLAVSALRRQAEAESQQAQVGGISKGIEPPEPAPEPRPERTVRPAERLPGPSPTRGAPASVTVTVRRTAPPSATAVATRAPAEPTQPQAGQPAPEVARRVREAAGRETDFYRRSLRAAGAGASVPHFRLEGVELRGWSAEVHLLAVLDDPEASVSRLLLPHADRQFLRLVAARILEDAPELASVELHLALQNGRSAPVDLGSVRMDPELLKLTAGLPIEELWERVDARQLESVWP